MEIVDEQKLASRTICYYIPFENWTINDVMAFVDNYMNLDHTWNVKTDDDDIVYMKEYAGMRAIVTNSYVYYALADTRRILYEKFVDKDGKIYYDFKVGN